MKCEDQVKKRNPSPWKMLVQEINENHLHHGSSVRTEVGYAGWSTQTILQSLLLHLCSDRHSKNATAAFRWGKSRALWMLQREERARQQEQHQSQTSRARSWGPPGPIPGGKVVWTSEFWIVLRSLQVVMFQGGQAEDISSYGNSRVKQSSLVRTQVLLEL